MRTQAEVARSGRPLIAEMKARLTASKTYRPYRCGLGIPRTSSPKPPLRRGFPHLVARTIQHSAFAIPAKENPIYRSRRFIPASLRIKYPAPDRFSFWKPYSGAPWRSRTTRCPTDGIPAEASIPPHRKGQPTNSSRAWSSAGLSFWSRATRSWLTSAMRSCRKTDSFR
jgi:hypothetical protein